MSRPIGSKNFNRRLLQDVLAEKNIDLVYEYFELLKEVDPEIKSRMLMHLMEFVFPKRRAEDADGTPGEAAVQITVTDEQLQRLVKSAKGEA